MAYIKIIDEVHAEGSLERIYKASTARTGRVANILKVQSTNAAALQGCMNLYVASTVQDNEHLSRQQREMLATVVSKANDCYY